jgi:hypothetical protein
MSRTYKRLERCCILTCSNAGKYLVLDTPYEEVYTCLHHLPKIIGLDWNKSILRISRFDIDFDKYGTEIFREKPLSRKERNIVRATNEFKTKKV